MKEVKKCERLESATNKEKGSLDNPYTIVQYEQMVEDSTWQGGYVEELGFMEELPENNILGGTDVYGIDETQSLEDHLKITSNFGIGNTIFVSAEVSNLYASHYSFSGSIEVCVNGHTEPRISLSKSGTYVTDDDYSLIGWAEADLSPFHGNVKVTCYIYGYMTTPKGILNISSQQIVYQGVR